MDLMTKYKNIYSEVSGDQLQSEINRIAKKTIADIINIGQWKSSTETIRFEAQADKIQKDVIFGKGKLIDFKSACERWKKEGSR